MSGVSVVSTSQSLEREEGISMTSGQDSVSKLSLTHLFFRELGNNCNLLRCGG